MLEIFLAWRLVAILRGQLIRVDKPRLRRRNVRMSNLSGIVVNHMSDGAEEDVIHSVLLW